MNHYDPPRNPNRKSRRAERKRARKQNRNSTYEPNMSTVQAASATPPGGGEPPSDDDTLEHLLQAVIKNDAHRKAEGAALGKLKGQLVEKKWLLEEVIEQARHFKILRGQLHQTIENIERVKTVSKRTDDPVTSQDRVTVGLYGVSAAALLGFGGVQMAVQVHAAQAPFFLDHPWMVGLTSGIPMGLAAVGEVILSTFKLDTTRRKALSILKWSAGGAALAFVGLFSGRFHSAFEGAPSFGNAVLATVFNYDIEYVIAQIVTEVLLSTLLFHGIHTVWGKYHVQVPQDDLFLAKSEDERDYTTEVLEPLVKEQARLESEIEQLETDLIQKQEIAAEGVRTKKTLLSVLLASLKSD